MASRATRGNKNTGLNEFYCPISTTFELIGFSRDFLSRQFLDSQFDVCCDLWLQGQKFVRRKGLIRYCNETINLKYRGEEAGKINFRCLDIAWEAIFSEKLYSVLNPARA